MEKKELKKQIVALLRRNARMAFQEMSDRLGVSEPEVAALVKQMEKDGEIVGYTAVINSEHDGDEVRAIIEIGVQPQRDIGFDHVAERLARFPEVVSVYLVSGQYDLRLEVVGKSLQDVASFVAGTLAQQEGVKSTATFFLLKKYKEAGVSFIKESKHERLQIVP
ncbi:MAG: Lrp/AsnC family transcriptional regulator [Victivallales bacterium]|nr:Lrp/AsnC family transcriptional regulator [Victivallales bacterium]